MIKVCSFCSLEYEANSEDRKMCFTCYKQITGQREIQRDEIIIDIDDPTLNGCMCVSATGINLFENEYHFSLWYADGMKQPHIHIKKIPHIADLRDDQLKEYKRLFLMKYIPKEFWNDKIPDFNLCIANHLIAEENKPHKKYKTLKSLRSEFNENKLNFSEVDLLDKVNEIKKEEYKPLIDGSGITAKITQVINIKDIARQYGLTIHGDKTLCPFHADSKSESLVFYNNGRFHCFGCNEDGNIIKFYALLKELNPKFKYKRVVENG